MILLVAGLFMVACDLESAGVSKIIPISIKESLILFASVD
jgi:hypothetical protein